ncbi:hypothetical protein DKX38_027746 [Salix brachista]|uniref:CCHC-type domain-containing protein n=1 Tax=Salix brachista TaxID=2182728 RepID=A0A5N5J7K0_9ROSI|nr:hypothetical protein DKX38_027746 [Salix brachista]
MEASNSTVTTETNLAFAATYSKPAASRRAKAPGFTNPSCSPSSYTRSPTHMGPSINKTNVPHSGDNRPTCQICIKRGHMALDCYNRFNFSYQGRLPPFDLAAMAAEGNISHAQQMWYADSGANAHITNSKSPSLFSFPQPTIQDTLTPEPNSTINDPEIPVVSDPEIPDPLPSDPSSDHQPPLSPISQDDPPTISPPPSHIHSITDNLASTSSTTHNTNRVITRSMT